jgi:bifunctional DNA-binding transcriptional regulator/antitoxin component of YhaV-PrlF toxin-antitoxin module
MAALDCHGRIADRTTLDALGWPVGHRLTIRGAAATLTVTADPAGQIQVIRRGHLRIPAALRHRYGLATGDRVLLAADPTRSHLTIYPRAALDNALTAQPAAPATTNGGDPT